MTADTYWSRSFMECITIHTYPFFISCDFALRIDLCRMSLMRNCSHIHRTRITTYNNSRLWLGYCLMPFGPETQSPKKIALTQL